MELVRTESPLISRPAYPYECLLDCWALSMQHTVWFFLERKQAGSAPEPSVSLGALGKITQATDPTRGTNTRARTVAHTTFGRPTRASRRRFRSAMAASSGRPRAVEVPRRVSRVASTPSVECSQWVLPQRTTRLAMKPPNRGNMTEHRAPCTQQQETRSSGTRANSSSALSPDRTLVIIENHCIMKDVVEVVMLVPPGWGTAIKHTPTHRLYRRRSNYMKEDPELPRTGSPMYSGTHTS
jgi:hypothetical protein